MQIGKNSFLHFIHPEEVEEEAEFSYSLFDLITAFKSVLEQARSRYMDVRAEESSIEEKMEYLKQRLAEQEVIAFEDLFETEPEATGEPVLVTDHGKPTIEVRRHRSLARSPLDLLRGSVVEYLEPTEPVGEQDWEALT